MIPKKIHYCWFGKNPLPDDALKCIASWRKFFPDYEIIEWNEDNFDVNEIAYTAQAYKAKKYAFVSDYARFKILYEQGGIYFDTDVEIIKSFEDILVQGAFMGRELYAKDGGLINPGLGIGVSSGHPIYKALIEYYSQLLFTKGDGSFNETTIVIYTTKILEQYGLNRTDSVEIIDGITVYPWDYFNPLDDLTGKLRITRNTHSIHWFSKSWLDQSALKTKLSRFSHRVLGISFISKAKRFFIK